MLSGGRDMPLPSPFLQKQKKNGPQKRSCITGKFQDAASEWEQNILATMHHPHHEVERLILF